MVVALCLIIIIGYAGVFKVNAQEKKPTLEDVVNIFLGNLQDIGEVPSVETEQMLGFSTQDEFWVNNDSGVIYFGQDKDVGVRISSGVLQGKLTTAGSWSAFGASTPGDEGWLAYEPIMVPATNEQGYRYALIIGGSETATSSITGATTATVMAVDGQMVVTGATTITGAATLSSTLAVTDAVTLTADMTVGTTLDVTGNTTLAGTLTVDGASTLTGAVGVTGLLTLNGNAVIQSFIDTAAAGLLAIGTSTATSIEIADTGVNTTINGGLTVDQATTLTGALTMTGAITGAGNWITTGNIAGANGTFTGSLTVDTNTLYVDNSNNAVGIGTTTPNITGASLAVYDEIIVFDATSPYDVLIELVDSDDDGVINVYANNVIKNQIHGNATSYFTGGTVAIGTTTSVAELSILEATNAQLSLHYDGDSYATFTTGSGGDITIVPSGGDATITGTLTVSGALTGNGSILVGVAGALDAAAATALSIGTSTATSIEIGDTTIVTNVQGPLTAAEAVTITGALTANASVLVGMAGALDSATAGALSIGTSTATSIQIGDTTVTTNIQGPLTAAETVVITGTLGVTGVTTLTTDLVVDTNTLVADASANMVGIGTTTPANQLSVHAATGTSTISIIAQTAGSGGRIILEDTDGAGCSEISLLNGTVISASITCPAN